MSNPIGWCDRTWNPITGCSPVSPACDNCYAERMSKRLAGRFGYSADEPFRVTLHPDRLHEPLRWRRPQRVFVCSMGDLFHEDVEDEWIDRVFATIACTPSDTYLLLTKRPERARAYLVRERKPWPVSLTSDWAWPLRNIFLGVTAEDQQRADERIPELLETPAAKRFVSLEPLLGQIDLEAVGAFGHSHLEYDREGQGHRMFDGDGIDWCIVGGESGPGARPMQSPWAFDLFEQCRDAGVPFFWKKGTPGINYDREMTACREFSE